MVDKIEIHGVEVEEEGDVEQELERVNRLYLTRKKPPVVVREELRCIKLQRGAREVGQRL
jgi:hypothetical protein